MSGFDPVKKPYQDLDNNNTNNNALPSAHYNMGPQVIDLTNFNASGGNNNNNNYNNNYNNDGVPPGKGGAEVVDLSNYPQNINYPDPNAAAAEGTPLYPEEETRANPHLARFVRQGFRDIWAAALFLLTFLFVVVFGIVNLASYKMANGGLNGTDSNGNVPTGDDAPNGATMSTLAVVLIVLIVAAVSYVTALLGMVLARCFPHQLIIIANVFTVVLTVAAAIMCFVIGNIFGGVILLVCAALSGLWLFLVRSRIAFSAALLKASVTVIGRYKALALSGLVMIAVLTAYTVMWGYAMLRPTDRIVANKHNAGDIVLILILVFIFFWTAQVIPNTMHVVTSGVVATWYFAGFDHMPRNPTLKSFVRATTTSFGSICFGSLLVAIVQFLRWLADSSRGNNNGDNACVNLMLCVLSCLLSLLQNIIEYFNQYAFVHVAVYGCGYIEAAKRTFALCKQCFFAAYFNDCLVNPVMAMLALALSVCLGALVGLIFFSWPVGVLAFFVALVVHGVVFSTISSAINTIFVCFAEVPEGLRASDPELYAAIHAADANGTNNNSAPPQPTNNNAAA